MPLFGICCIWRSDQRVVPLSNWHQHPSKCRANNLNASPTLLCATAPFSVMSRRDDGETSRSECGREASGRRKATRPGRSWWFSCLQILISVHLKNRVHVHSTAGSSSKHLRWRIPFSTIESEPHREWSEQIESSSSTRTDPSGPVSGLLKKAGAPWRGGRRRSRHSTGRQPLLCQQRRSRFTAKSRGCQRGRHPVPRAGGPLAHSRGPGQVRHGSLF